jgi:hypothetical protein
MALYQERGGFERVAVQAHVARLSREGISVCRFASAEDAVTAASVAFHALRQYLAERNGRGDDAAEVTVRRVPEGTGAPFCFELRFPMRLAPTAAIRAAHAIDDVLDRWRKQRSEGADDTGDSAVAEERDDVGEDSIQSFPASDPPGWISMWLGTPGKGTHREEAV